MRGASKLKALAETQFRFSKPRNFLQQRGSGFPRNERDDEDLPACLFHGAAFILVQRFKRVVAAFDIDIGLRDGKEARCRPVGKNADTSDAFERRKDCCAIRFTVNRAIRSFEFVNSAIAVDPDEQCIALIAGRFEISHMPQVKQVKAPIRSDESPATCAHG